MRTRYVVLRGLNYVITRFLFFLLFTHWNLKPAIWWCRGCMGCFKSLPRKYFWVLFWLKCIKCRHVFSAIDEDFYLIIPVLLLLRTMEIYYTLMGELKFKEHRFCDDRNSYDILSCCLKKLFFLCLLKSNVDLVFGIKRI